MFKMVLRRIWTCKDKWESIQVNDMVSRGKKVLSYLKNAKYFYLATMESI